MLLKSKYFSSIHYMKFALWHII